MSEQARGSEGQARRPGRRRWFLYGALSGLGVALLVGLAVAAVALLLSASSGVPAPATYDEEYVLGEGGEKIAVVPVVGTMGTDITADDFRAAITQAESDSSVVGVVLEIESPGGGVAASYDMHAIIEDYKEVTGNPVVVSMGETAASGGYYISCAADEIVAHPSTITGSLGTIIRIVNYEEAQDKLGIVEEKYKSGDFKDMFSSSNDRTPEEKAALQKMVDDGYDEFVGVIVEGRGLSEERVRELADGRVYSGEDAKELGLVDSLGDLETAVNRVEERSDTEETTTVRYVQEPTLVDLATGALGSFQGEQGGFSGIIDKWGLGPGTRLEYIFRP